MIFRILINRESEAGCSYEGFKVAIQSDET